MKSTEQQTPSSPSAAPAVVNGPIRLTDKAVQMVKMTREQENLDENAALRVAVRGGGCSGFEYALDFDTERREDDWALEYDGLTVYVDPISARYLEGTEIDYVFSPTGAGFKFNNPKATGTCGCGSSFAV